MKKNYYQILGVDTSATNQEIKNAYRLFARKLHPDNNKGDKFFEDRFKEIQESYTILNNSEKKAAYDLSFFNENSYEQVYDYCPITKENATKEMILYNWSWYFIYFSFKKVSILVSENGYKEQKKSMSFFWRVLTPSILFSAKIPLLGTVLIIFLLVYCSFPLLIISIIVDLVKGTKILSRGRLRLKSNKIYLDKKLLKEFQINFN